MFRLLDCNTCCNSSRNLRIRNMSEHALVVTGGQVCVPPHDFFRTVPVPKANVVERHAVPDAIADAVMPQRVKSERLFRRGFSSESRSLPRRLPVTLVQIGMAQRSASARPKYTARCAPFQVCGNGVNQAAVHGTNLMPVALNIVVTFVTFGVMLFAIFKFWSAQRQLAERLRQSALSQTVIDRIKQVGRLESLAGQADWLARNLEEVWHAFHNEKKNMPNPIGRTAVPDVIEQWTDKQLWRFRVHYQSYLGSMKAVDPRCDSALMNDGFPHDMEDYLSVKRKIEEHAATMRRRAADLMSSANAQYAAAGTGN